MKIFFWRPSLIFFAAPSAGAVNIWIYFTSHLFFKLSTRYSLFTLRVSSLLSPLNDGSGDIVDDEGSFQFSPEPELTSALHVHSTLATDTEAGSLCFAQQLQC